MILVVGTHTIGKPGIDKTSREDRAQDGLTVAYQVSQFADPPIQVVHMDRPTPFEKLVTDVCRANGFADVRVTEKQLAMMVNNQQLNEGCLAFVKVGSTGGIKQTVAQLEAAGVQVLEVTL